MTRLLRFLAVLLAASSALARVERIEIVSRRDYAGGKSFGLAGPYERIQAHVVYAVDPKVRFPEFRASFIGSFVAWPKAEILESFHNRDEYLGRFTEATLNLVKERFLVVDDVPSVIQRGGEEFSWATK
jgi:hypothetical protein